MFNRPEREPVQRASRQLARLALEEMEDRCVPHTGVTLFSAGLTAGAAPAGIVRGPDNNYWFTEFSASKIARITEVGVITEFTLPAGRGPLNITVGPDNNLWFTENTGDRIGRINPLAGNDAAIQSSLTEFAVPGAGSAPNDIVTGPDGALWFTETGSDEIGRITTAGIVTNEFTVPGPGSAPAGIALGSDGNLWFTEAGSGEIGRITTGGSFTEFTIPVPSAGAFSDPEDIVSGPGGALYFTDFGRDQIGRITTAGAITQFNLPVGRGPQQIVAFNDGDLYFTEAASSRIGRLPASALAPGAPGSGSPPLEEFDFIPRDSVPLGITISASGDIWFTLNNGNAVGNFLAHLQQLTATSTGPNVQVYDVHLQQVRTFTPFPGYQGTLSLAVGDTNRNGIPDVIVGTGPGGPNHIMVFDGSDNRLLASFYAFGPGFTGGLSLGSEDVNGDGYGDIVVGTAGVSSHVKVIDGTKLSQVLPNGQIADSALLGSFFAFGPLFPGGVTVSAGDLNGDGKAEVVVGARLGSSHVKVVDATKLTQVLPSGQIADSALLGSFFAFTPLFAGGVNVTVSKNVAQRDIIVGAGAGASHVKMINGTKLNQVLPGGQIADTALLASFYAFSPFFAGGVRVAGDDLNFDGFAELILGAGPGAGPHVKVVDGTRATQVTPDGQIADAALTGSFFTGNPAFTGGVFVASDADHRDGTIFGPPGVTIDSSRRDINDMFIFQSPANAANTVLAMDVSPFSSTGTPAQFVPGLLYDFRIVNRDLLNASDDLVFRVTFGPPDAAAGGRQDVTVRALPGAKFAGVGGVIVKGFTGQNVAIRGVGGSGAQFRAAEQDDPFFFDADGFGSRTSPKALLNHNTAVDAVVAGDWPRGTSPNGFGPGSTPNYDAPNFFSGANTLSIIFELPSAAITGPATDSVSGDPALGFWGRTEANGVQLDRMGRPAINTALIPPVPRGVNFPVDGSTPTRVDLRNAFNAGHPRDDVANFADDVANVLAAFYPIGRPTNGANPSQDLAQAQIVASLLMPDILVYRPTSSAGFFQDTIGTLGSPGFFLAGGRKFSDNIIDTEIQVLTDRDTPFNLDGGANDPPAVVTNNVRDDNGQNLPDGSIDLPVAQGGMGTGQRPIMFPYIGAPNPNPSNVPGGNPPA